MTVSQAKIDANRRNAQMSTGPRTQEGKDRSRANALKHGLCSTALVPENLEVVQQRSNEWYGALKPQNPHQGWIVKQIAVISLRMDRSERMERRLRDREMLKAELDWDEQRRVEVETLGAKLTKRPAETVRQLRLSPQGCSWIIERWAMLIASANKNGTWSQDQNRLAFDLLGTPHEMRQGHQPGDIVDMDGKVIEVNLDRVAMARKEIEGLKERREKVAEFDEVDKALVTADMFDGTNVELKRLRRYDSAMFGRMKFFMKLMQDKCPYKHPDPLFKPQYVTGHEEEKPAGPVVQPDVLPVPWVPKGETELEEILRIGEARKDASGREARRKKVERLRA